MDCSRFMVALTLLFLFPFADLVLSLHCGPTQYPWPSDRPQFCCNSCPPGQYVHKRDKNTCQIDCQPCTGERYTDTYNLGSCQICDACSKENMEIVSECNATRNAVCRCKAGFACENEACDYCTAIPTTTTPPAATHSTTAVSKHEVRPTLQASKPIQDTAWFLVIICLLCVGLALVIVTKIKPLLNWFTHGKTYHMQVEEEPACVPVQEMFGKCDV